ncbi:MAG: M23 family metallopeptidase, partial [Clostridiales bacterium]|nr:M23 family metallopeptidase [Clostridiales bacterium]
MKPSRSKTRPFKRLLRLLSYPAALLLCAVLLSFTVADAVRFASLYAYVSPVPDGDFFPEKPEEPKKYIKWAEFNIPSAALDRAYAADLKAYKEGKRAGWIDSLALLGTKYSGHWKRYRAADLDAIAAGLKKGDPFDKLKSNKYYPYFYEVYETVLKEYVGPYKIEAPDPADKTKTAVAEKYGLKCFSPIAAGYGYSEFDDFGVSRSYGYKRRHLGHDMMGRVGTPIVAVEGGDIEEAGWNQYGGWRVGVRSFDKKRYYYYAHLRKGHPFGLNIVKGGRVEAGDVIGYLGMTGYSPRENVNNINTPHLHFGLQLIFDEVQKDGVNQIWIDVYALTNFLRKNRSQVVYREDTKDYV